MNKKIKKLKENSTGRNTLFKVGNREMTRKQTVSFIEENPDCDYHNRTINGLKTPCSNPDKSKKNNLN